jgi:hypothetical protein
MGTKRAVHFVIYQNEASGFVKTSNNNFSSSDAVEARRRRIRKKSTRMEDSNLAMASAGDLSPNANSKSINNQVPHAEDPPPQLSPTPNDILETCRGTKDVHRYNLRSGKTPGSRVHNLDKV